MKKRLAAAIGLAILVLLPAAPASALEYEGNPALAARQNNAEAVREMLVGGTGNPDQTDDASRTALQYAAINGNLEIVAILIKSGAKLDLADPLGNTALHLAAQRNKTEAAELLLAAGAAVDPQNRDGMTPLMVAASRGNSKLVLDLLAKGASPTLTDYTGRDAVSWAEEGRHPGIVSALKRAAGGKGS
jgi:ankyrin repeat protein